MTLHEIPLLLIQMESQQCSEHLFNVRITREQPKWHSNGIWDAKMTLLFFSSIKSSDNVQCTSSKCIYRWVSERVGEWLPRKLLPHSRRIVNFSAVGPFTIRTVSGELGAGLGTIKSLRQLAHYFVFCRKPFNLEPRQRSPCRWEMENCRRGAADLFHLAKKRESVLHARLWVCVYVCAPLSNYFWLFHQWLGITSFGSATPPSASLAFSIFFFSSHRFLIFVRLVPGHSVCGAAIDRKNISTQQPNTGTGTEGKRNNLIFLWEILPDLRFPFLSSLRSSTRDCKDWIARFIYSLWMCCFVFGVWMNSERWTAYVVYFLPLILFMCCCCYCCITSIVFKRRRWRKKLRPKIARAKRERESDSGSVLRSRIQKTALSVILRLDAIVGLLNKLQSANHSIPFPLSFLNFGSAQRQW